MSNLPARGVVGRPVTSSKAKRLVDIRREQAALRLWRKTPDVLSYVLDVALGKQPADKERLEAARMILNRTIPTITAQTIQADTTTITATVPPDAVDFFKSELARLSAGVNGGSKS